MGCSTLNSSSCRGDETLNGGGVVPSGEFLLVRLLSRNDGDGDQVDVDFAVEFQDVQYFLSGFISGQEGAVSFLPEEFPGSEERLWTGLLACLLVRRQ